MTKKQALKFVEEAKALGATVKETRNADNFFNSETYEIIFIRDHRCFELRDYAQIFITIRNKSRLHKRTSVTKSVLFSWDDPTKDEPKHDNFSIDYAMEKAMDWKEECGLAKDH